MSELLLAGIVIGMVVLVSEVFRLRSLCAELQRNNSVVPAAIRTQSIILTDATGTERYTISLADNPEHEATRKYLRSQHVEPPGFPPMLQVKAGGTTVLTLDNDDSIKLYSEKISLHADSVVVANSDDAAREDVASDLATHVAMMSDPGVEPLAVGNVFGADYGSVGVIFRRGEPEVWVWRKGDHMPGLTTLLG